MSSELQIKQRRLGEYLDRHQLDGVLLTRRDNFSWITCGRDNHIANNTPGGVATIFASRDGSRVCFANAIEAPRMKREELRDTGIETIDFSWWDPAASRKAVEGVIGGKKVATDSDTFGLPVPPLPPGFDPLRWSLSPEEIARYREGGKRAALAMEQACRALRPGMSEHEAAGILDHHIRAGGMTPLVTLVAADERISSFRHPIPTDHALREQVMLVTCAWLGGLISCLTRFVRFSPMPAEQKARQQAIANIDAAVILATRPGRTLAEIFDDLRQAYARNGHADQWQLHHQGGPTGYNNREGIATPTNETRVVENQAFAWNPSIVGAKSEDSVLCTANGIEVLTPHSNDWPTMTGRAENHELNRADVLVL